MKVKEIRTYQSVRLAGSLGEINFINLVDKRHSHFDLEVKEGVGIKVVYEYNAKEGQKAKETIVVPFTNIAYYKEAGVKLKEDKAK